VPKTRRKDLKNLINIFIYVLIKMNKEETLEGLLKTYTPENFKKIGFILKR
jgi:hypothetical protein